MEIMGEKGTEKLLWEKVEHFPAIRESIKIVAAERAKIPGGWLVRVWGETKMGSKQSEYTVIFVPNSDPK
jgi:hypothetical protein